MRGLDAYDRPVVNIGSEVIPPWGVMQVAGWETNSNGLAVFKVKKPDSSGTHYLINGLNPIPPPSSQDTGMAYGVRAHGHYALFDETLNPQVNNELGPVPGEWYLGTGSGFLVDGDVQGSPTSPPGYPFIESTLRVRVVMQPAAAVDNIIIGTVVSSFTEANATFVINNVTVVSGVDPTGGNPTVGVIIQNDPPQSGTGGVTRIRAKQNKTTGLWFPDLGGTAGSQVIGFRLVEDKSYADEAKLAKPINLDGTLNSSAASFYVVDHEHQFYGKAAYTDGDSEAEVFAGYYGEAVLYIEDYASGIPGYRILKMEGPAQWLKVTLTDHVGATNPDEAGATISPEDFRGRPFSNRRPRLAGNSPNFTVFDDFQIAQAAKSGEVWIVKWSESEEHYILWAPLPIGGELFRTAQTIPARSFSSPTLTPGQGTANKFIYQHDDATWVLDTVTSYILYNSSSSSILSGRIVQIKFIDGKRFIDVDDC